MVIWFNPYLEFVVILIYMHVSGEHFQANAHSRKRQGKYSKVEGSKFLNFIDSNTEAENVTLLQREVNFTLDLSLNRFKEITTVSPKTSTLVTLLKGERSYHDWIDAENMTAKTLDKSDSKTAGISQPDRKKKKIFRHPKKLSRVTGCKNDQPGPEDASTTDIVDIGGVTKGQVIVCKNRSCGHECGFSFLPPKCSCDEMCYLYDSCCVDVDTECPGLFPSPTLASELQNTRPVCDTEFYIIDRCPHGKTLENFNGSNSAIRDTLYISDTRTGLVFKNLSVYMCYYQNVDNVSFWGIELELTEQLYTLRSTKDVMDALAQLNSSFLQTSSDERVHDCMKPLKERGHYRFSVLLSISESFKVTLTRKIRGPKQWVRISCDQDYNGSCKQDRCHMAVSQSDGVCVFQTSYQITVSHPPMDAVNNETVKDMAEKIVGELKRRSSVFAAEVHDILVSNPWNYKVYAKRFKFDRVENSFFSIIIYLNESLGDGELRRIMEETFSQSLNEMKTTIDRDTGENSNVLSPETGLPIVYCIDFNYELITDFKQCQIRAEAELTNQVGYQHCCQPWYSNQYKTGALGQQTLLCVFTIWMCFRMII